MDKVQHLLHENPALVPLIVLVMSLGVFAILVGNKFFSPFALTLILQQVQIVGVLAAAQSLIILTAGIDLSVGAIAVLCSVVMGQFTFRYGFPAIISIPIGLVAGTAIGAASGWLVAKVKLPPFIVTLGMWQIVLAANYIYSANETIRSQDIEAQAPMLQMFGHTLKFAGATFTLGVFGFTEPTPDRNAKHSSAPCVGRRGKYCQVALVSRQKQSQPKYPCPQCGVKDVRSKYGQSSIDAHDAAAVATQVTTTTSVNDALKAGLLETIKMRRKKRKKLLLRTPR